MLDPVSTALIGAFTVGAAKGVTDVGEKVLVDAYAALKHVVIATYGSASRLFGAVTALEEKPESKGRKETLAEELADAGALDNDALLRAAEAVLAAGKASGQAVGVDWQDVRAAELEIGRIRARAGSIGFRAARMEIAGKVTIPEIDAGN